MGQGIDRWIHASNGVNDWKGVLLPYNVCQLYRWMFPLGGFRQVIETSSCPIRCTCKVVFLVTCWFDTCTRHGWEGTIFSTP